MDFKQHIDNGIGALTMTWTEREKAYKIKARLRNQKWLLDYKHEQGCQNCGEKNPLILELHHPSGTNEKRASDMVSYSIKRIEKEATSCVVLCCNCHRVVHWGKTKANTTWIKINGHKL